MKKFLISIIAALTLAGGALAQNPTLGDTNRLARSINGKIGLDTNNATAGQVPVFNAGQVSWGNVSGTGFGDVFTTSNNVFVASKTNTFNGTVRFNGSTSATNGFTLFGASTNSSYGIATDSPVFNFTNNAQRFQIFLDSQPDLNFIMHDPARRIRFGFPAAAKLTIDGSADLVTIGGNVVAQGNVTLGSSLINLLTLHAGFLTNTTAVTWDGAGITYRQPIVFRETASFLKEANGIGTNASAFVYTTNLVNAIGGSFGIAREIGSGHTSWTTYIDTAGSWRLRYSGGVEPILADVSGGLYLGVAGQNLRITTELNANGFNITNLLAGVSPLDAVNVTQLQGATNSLGTGFVTLGTAQTITGAKSFTTATTTFGSAVNFTNGAVNYSGGTVNISVPATLNFNNSAFAVTMGGTARAMVGSIATNWFFGDAGSSTGTSFENLLGGFQSGLNPTGVTTVNRLTTWGIRALSVMTNGSYNVAIGYEAGYNASTPIRAGEALTFLGARTTATSGTWTNSTAVGDSATITASNQMTLGASNLTSTILFGGVKANGSLTVAGALTNSGDSVLSGNVTIGSGSGNFVTMNASTSVVSSAGLTYNVNGNSRQWTLHQNGSNYMNGALGMWNADATRTNFLFSSGTDWFFRGAGHTTFQDAAGNTRARVDTSGNLVGFFNVNSLGKTTAGANGTAFVSPAIQVTLGTVPAIVPGTAFATNYTMTFATNGAPFLTPGLTIANTALNWQAFCTNNGVATLVIQNSQLVGNITPDASTVIQLRQMAP